MPTRHRRDRRSNDGLYQAHRHRWLQDRAKAAQAARRALTIEELKQRAEEARRHSCTETFVSPEIVLELLQARQRLKLVEELIELHWEMAQEEKGRVLSKRDRMLWTQTIKGFSKRPE